MLKEKALTDQILEASQLTGVTPLARTAAGESDLELLINRQLMRLGKAPKDIYPKAPRRADVVPRRARTRLRQVDGVLTLKFLVHQWLAHALADMGPPTELAAGAAITGAAWMPESGRNVNPISWVAEPVPFHVDGMRDYGKAQEYLVRTCVEDPAGRHIVDATLSKNTEIRPNVHERDGLSRTQERPRARVVEVYTCGAIDLTVATPLHMDIKRLGGENTAFDYAGYPPIAEWFRAASAKLYAKHSDYEFKGHITVVDKTSTAEPVAKKAKVEATPACVMS